MFIFAPSQPHGIAVFQPVTPSGTIQQWTRPPGVRILRRVLVVGGGGGGGNNEGQPVPKGGGGGGGGEAALLEFFPVPFQVTWDIVVGLGGREDSPVLPVEDGEVSTLSGVSVPGTTIFAAGGFAGAQGVPFSSGGPGGAGGGVNGGSGGAGGTSGSPVGVNGGAGGSSIDGNGVSRRGGGGGGGGGWQAASGLGGLHGLAGSPAPLESGGGGIAEFLAGFGGVGSPTVGLPLPGNDGLVIIEW